MDSKAIPNRTVVGLIGDMAELLARAFFGGLAAAVAMGAAILALSASAQASPHTAAFPPLGYVVAASSGSDDASDALQLLLGLVALLSAGVVAVVGHRAPRA